MPHFVDFDHVEAVRNLYGLRQDGLLQPLSRRPYPMQHGHVVRADDFRDAAEAQASFVQPYRLQALRVRNFSRPSVTV